MSGFDRLARPYRWMEYLSFGRALERCRFHFLSQLTGTKNALLLGDGDGRFAARLLQRAPDAQVLAVDGSAAMLTALRSRCAFASNRLNTQRADLSKSFVISDADFFDLVTTHFFLDCLDTAEVEGLVANVKPHMTVSGRWVISEFAVPQRGAMRLPAWLIVRGLYLSFRLLTGLQTQHLPDYRSVLLKHGFVMAQQATMLRGLLVAEMWRAPIQQERLELEMR